MTDTGTESEVGPLPEGGPTTLDLVRTRLKFPADDTADDDELEGIVAAVNDTVRGFASADAARGLDAWPSRFELGATMLAARLWRRKDTPQGVATFGDSAPVYIQRNDPDVALLLRIGAYAKPVVG